MILNDNSVLLIKTNVEEKSASVEFTSEKQIESYSLTVLDNEKNVVKKIVNTVDATSFIAKVDFNSITLWSIETPYLYSLELNVNYENENVTISDRFAFRTLKIEGNKFLINGVPFYQRGYIRGHKCHDHSNNCNLPLIDFYRKNIRQAKKYGFNTIRFHSTVPPKECFDAADELGMMIHVETQPKKVEYNNIEEMVFAKKQLVDNDQIKEIVLSNYNHPSLMTYCIGNEIKKPGKHERAKEILAYIRELDQTRFVIDTCAHGEYDREDVDFDVQHMGYYFPIGVHDEMFESSENLLCFGSVDDKDMFIENENSSIRRTPFFERPVIAHEVCHYTALRDFTALKEKFEKYGTEKPWWIEEELKMIKAKGLEDKYEDMRIASKLFQLATWKKAFESMRMSEFLTGYHFLQFSDTDVYENSNGIVDCFDDDQGVDSDEFKKFNGDTVVLAKFRKFEYVEGETFEVPVFVSQYEKFNNKYGVINYVLKSDDKVITKGSLTKLEMTRYGVNKVCTITLKMPEIDKSQALEFALSIDIDDKVISNSWTIFLYKKDVDLIEVKTNLNQYDFSDIVKETKSSNVYVTDTVDDDFFKKLETEEKVILLYRQDLTRHMKNKKPSPKYAFKASWNRFKPVIWDRGTNYGGLVNGELLTKHGFASSNIIDFRYYATTEDCDKVILDDFPVKVNSIISGTDKNCRDRFDVYPKYFGLSELQYDRTLRDYSYCFELKVGKCKLIVTGMNFNGIKKYPSTLCMFDTLVKYAKSSEFNPSAEISVEDFKNYMIKCAKHPVIERMMTIYWALDEEPVESADYWKNSQIYVREEEAKLKED
ncbi:MAG: hypothetical protein IKA85_05935 [Clostridia bacterium]|nr:hypothetical protein [Clostridia bacterium]